MRGLLVVGLVMGLLGACSTTSSNSGGDDCAVGSLGCPCTSGGVCDSGLTCDPTLEVCVTTANGGTGGRGQGGSNAGSGGMSSGGSGASGGISSGGTNSGGSTTGGSAGQEGGAGAGAAAGMGGVMSVGGVGGSAGTAGMSSGGAGGGTCTPLEDWEACGNWICGTVSDGCTSHYTCGSCGSVSSAHCRAGRCCNRWTQYDHGNACNGVRPYYITCTDDSDQPPEASCVYYGHHISTPGYGRAFCCATEM